MKTRSTENLSQNSDNIRGICSRVGYVFKNPDLLLNALRHPAYYGDQESPSSFERLEFLGDRVFNLSLADLLYNRFLSESEGDLAVRQAYFSSASFMIDIAKFSGLVGFLDVPLNKTTGELSKSALADTVEALVGAIYLDGGYEEALRVVSNWVQRYITKPIDDLRDPKSTLQEWSQSHKIGLPIYKVIDREGEDHSPLFTVQVFVGDSLTSYGTGASKQSAEQHAAESLLKKLQQENL